MRIVRLSLLLCGLWWWPAALPAADAPVLAKLEYRGGLFPKRTSISVLPGLQLSPYAGQPRQIWTLRAGDTLTQLSAPTERFIRFYRVVGQDSETVCTIIVSYAGGPGNWRPRYQILQTPMLSHNGKKLVPLPSQEGARGLIQLFDMQAAEGDGYYPWLYFGYASEPTTIDAWEVQ